MKSHLATHSPVPAILESPEAIRAQCAHRPTTSKKAQQKQISLFYANSLLVY